MTNLEIVLIYFAIGLLFTLAISEIRHSYLDTEDVMFGTTLWLPIAFLVIVYCVSRKIMKVWSRRAKNDL